MLEELYCAAIATDIIDSRKFHSESVLNDIVGDLNRIFHNSLVTPFSVRMGDEIIGAVANFSDGYNVLTELYRITKKHRIGMYVGLGFGTIDTEERIDIHRVNGSAIRSAITARDSYVKNQTSTSALFNRHQTQYRFFAYAEDSFIPYRAINHYLHFLMEKLETRTDKQIEIIELMERNPELTYKEIGDLLGLSKHAESNISRLLARADYHLVKDAEQSLLDLLDFMQSQVMIQGKEE